jgi:hypothetical protein
MALTVKTLNDGQIDDEQGLLYEVPAGMAAVVKNIRLVNTDTQSRTLTLYYLRSEGEDARLISPQNVSLPPGAMLIEDNELSMGAGDQILGVADEAEKIDYVISGIERDAS